MSVVFSYDYAQFERFRCVDYGSKRLEYTVTLNFICLVRRMLASNRFGVIRLREVRNLTWATMLA